MDGYGPATNSADVRAAHTVEATQPVEVLGIDAGGTMTDTFFIRPGGSFVVGKTQTTRQDESEGILRSASDALKQWGPRFGAGVSGPHQLCLLRHHDVQPSRATPGSERWPECQPWRGRLPAHARGAVLLGLLLRLTIPLRPVGSLSSLEQAVSREEWSHGSPGDAGGFHGDVSDAGRVPAGAFRAALAD